MSDNLAHNLNKERSLKSYYKDQCAKLRLSIETDPTKVAKQCDLNLHSQLTDKITELKQTIHKEQHRTNYYKKVADENKAVIVRGEQAKILVKVFKAGKLNMTLVEIAAICNVSKSKVYALSKEGK